MKKRVAHLVRRFAAAWLVFLLVAGMVPAAASADEGPAQTERPAPLDRYSDRPERGFDLDALAFLTDIGAIEPKEDGRFAPGEPVTRAELAVWLARSLGLRPAPGSPFPDVPDGAEEAPYIQALYQAGWIRGYGDGTFRGDRPITRAEAAVLLAGITGRPAAPRQAAVFADVDETDWFSGAVGTLAGMNVVSGKAPGIFAPSDKLTRGEAAALVFRLLFEPDRIEALDDETVTISGRAYRWDERLAGLFREANREALAGAAIRFEHEDGTIVSVTGLVLAAGLSPEGRVPVLDGGGAAIDGSLYLATDEIIIANLLVRKHVVVMPQARGSVLFDGVLAAGAVLLPADGTDESKFVFLFSDTVHFVRGITVGRDAAIGRADILFGWKRKDDGAAVPAAAKSGKPVSISEVSPVFSDPSLERLKNSDLIDAGILPAVTDAITSGLLPPDGAWEHFLNFGNGAPSEASFDPDQYLNNNPDYLANLPSPSSTWEHFLE
jgi:hypothetical protein